MLFKNIIVKIVYTYDYNFRGGGLSVLPPFSDLLTKLHTSNNLVRY